MSEFINTVSPPRSGLIDSENRLPQSGYTFDQLKDYILRQLGYPTWTVELTNEQIGDCIGDALSLYSMWVPALNVGNIQLVQGQYQYMKGVDVEQGVVDVQFVEPNPVPTEIFYGNLINPAPLFRTGLDEYDSFLRWRHTWARVTSIKPDWFYDEPRGLLYIHNPIERYQAGIFMHGTWADTTLLKLQGSQWVRKYALECSRFLYGEVLAKFSGAIPGPGQNLQLDQAKRDKAQVRIDKLEEEVKGMQTGPAISTDDV